MAEIHQKQCHFPGTVWARIFAKEYLALVVISSALSVVRSWKRVSKKETVVNRLKNPLVVLIALIGLMTLITVSGGGGGRVSGQGNDPPNQVVFLHYDYMIASDHSHAPDPLAIQIVVEAFRRHGITLYIDPQHTEIPERKVIT